MMYKLDIDASPKQLSKLRNGHSVRIKKGTGCCLIVSPETYKIASRAFDKGKPKQLKLSPSEIDMNRRFSSLTPAEMDMLGESKDELDMGLREVVSKEMLGKGIFGKRFDRMAERVLGKEKKEKLYKLSEHLKEPAKMLAKTGLTAGATALGAANPALIPLLAPGVAGASSLISDYIDNPDKYQEMFGSGITAPRHGRMVDKASHMLLVDKLNKELGKNYDYMGRAGMEQAISNKLRANLEKDSIDARKAMMPASFDKSDVKQPPSRLPSGLKEVGIVGRGAGMMGAPQAVASQPFTANYQMKNMLPPVYQDLNKLVDTVGQGLYARGPSGRGLYA